MILLQDTILGFLFVHSLYTSSRVKMTRYKAVVPCENKIILKNVKVAWNHI